MALGVMLPEGAPAEFGEPARLWNAAEAAEKRKDAQVAREVVLALPKEGGPEDWQALTLRFGSAQDTCKNRSQGSGAASIVLLGRGKRPFPLFLCRSHGC